VKRGVFYTEWERWFAWFPVKTKYAGWKFFTWIYRRPYLWVEGYKYSDFPEIDQEVVAIRK